MRGSIGAAVLLSILVVGCNNQEDQLKQQLSQAQSNDSTLQASLSERDKFMQQVVAAVNDAYANIEKARAKEKGVAHLAETPEGARKATTVVTKEDMLQDLAQISAALQGNQKRISELQRKNRTFGRQLASLDTLINNLKTSLQEREEAIAQLQGRIQGLEANVADNMRTIAGKDSVIDVQRRTINTAYYVVGTKDELRKKGIITDTGGFLWGLLGSTTVLTDSLNESAFEPIDRTTNGSISVNGTIDQIIPSRSEDTFATASDKTNSKLTILSPRKFWKQRYLVIVVAG
jgi:outer membrane murein-binding lipoprotein Lpp